MNPKFYNLTQERRDEILNVALEEFAVHGYKKASTNIIVKKANISKGLLYHYFSSKEVLYNFLMEFCYNEMFEALSKNIDWSQEDLFLRIKEVILIKLKVAMNYPRMMDFIMQVYKSGDFTIVNQEHLEATSRLSQEIYSKNIDKSKFKRTFDEEKVVQIIQWVLEKYGEESLEALQNHEDYDYKDAVKGIDAYLEILREAFMEG